MPFFAEGETDLPESKDRTNFLIVELQLSDNVIKISLVLSKESF
jgi:hypothetical protein